MKIFYLFFPNYGSCKLYPMYTSYQRSSQQVTKHLVKHCNSITQCNLLYFCFKINSICKNHTIFCIKLRYSNGAVNLQIMKMFLNENKANAYNNNIILNN